MILENEILRVAFHPDTGGFSSLLDKRIGLDYVQAPDRVRLFRLMTPEGAQACRHVDSHSVRIEREGCTARLRYSLGGIDAEAEIALEGDAILASLQLTNRSGSRIEEILFPMLGSLKPLEGASLVWPRYHGRRIEDLFGKGLGGDHVTWNRVAQKACARYPESLAAAWCDYGPSTHGIALRGMGKDFSILDFFVEKIVEKDDDGIRHALDLSTVIPRRLEPGETFRTPVLSILLHAEDWHETADRHRAWSETWIQKPDRPAHFAESIGWHFFFMKHQDGWVAHDYEDLEAMAVAAKSAGCTHVLLFGWQACGHDNAYLYGYEANPDWGGGPALKRAIGKAKALGIGVIPFFNGTLANTEMPQHKETGVAWESRTYTGHPYYAGDWARHNFDAETRNRSMLHHEMCPCEGLQAYWRENFTRFFDEYGFENIHLDQIAEKMLVCYNTEHKHAHPDAAYPEGYARLLPEIRKRIRAVNPEGVMISEALNDFTGQWCDGSWDWGALASFPEPLLYSVPWLHGSLEVDALEYAQVVYAFVHRLHLDLKIDGGDTPITRYPRFAAFVRRLAELKIRVAGHHARADFRDREGVAVLRGDALVKVYRNPQEGKSAIVVGETSGVRSEVEITIGAPFLGREALIASSDAADSREFLQPSLRLFLAPYEVKVVCTEGL